MLMLISQTKKVRLRMNDFLKVTQIRCGNVRF